MKSGRNHPLGKEMTPKKYIDNYKGGIYKVARTRHAEPFSWWGAFRCRS